MKQFYEDYEFAWFDWFGYCIIGLIIASAFCSSAASMREIKLLKETVIAQEVRIADLENEINER